MIELRDIVYRVGDFELQIDLKISDGEYCVLFGRSGCGKTSLLECICGLREPQSGRVLIGGEDVTELEPRARGIGYVPQDGALFEHLSVRGNIEFGLKVKGVSASDRKVLVEQVAGDMQISHLLGRGIAGLSGGERQRVALCRAVVHNPRLLLLDEPVSALDECTRDAICRELIELQRKRKMVVVHVCHSFEEARMVAGRIAVMQAGRLVQTGTARQLEEQPRVVYVAEVLRLGNIFKGRVEQDGVAHVMMVGDYCLRVPAAAAAGGQVMIAPWLVQLGDSGDVVMDGVVKRFSVEGAVARIELDDPIGLVALLARDAVADLVVGDKLRLSYNLADVVVFGR
jgi:ABC-type sugar transport system ATPase subunit